MYSVLYKCFMYVMYVRLTHIMKITYLLTYLLKTKSRWVGRGSRKQRWEESVAKAVRGVMARLDGDRSQSRQAAFTLAH